MPQSLPDPSTWQLGDVQVSARGAKFAPLTSHGKPVSFTLTDVAHPLSSPWGAGTYDQDAKDQDRLSVSFVTTPELEDFFRKVDQWFVKYVSQHSVRLLKKPLSEEGVRTLYNPTLKEKPPYTPTIRCKFNVSGSRVCKCWDEAFQPRRLPEDWKVCEVVPSICVTQMWVTGTCGLVLQMNDALVIERDMTCPFKPEEPEPEKPGLAPTGP